MVKIAGMPACVRHGDAGPAGSLRATWGMAAPPSGEAPTRARTLPTCFMPRCIGSWKDAPAARIRLRLRYCFMTSSRKVTPARCASTFTRPDYQTISLASWKTTQPPLPGAPSRRTYPARPFHVPRPRLRSFIRANSRGAASASPRTLAAARMNPPTPPCDSSTSDYSTFCGGPPSGMDNGNCSNAFPPSTGTYRSTISSPAHGRSRTASASSSQ